MIDDLSLNPCSGGNRCANRPRSISPITTVQLIPDADFGEYSTHELGIQPDAYDPKLDIDFTALRKGS
ncbi:hypothetical protein [Streptomyces sp. NBC_00059]|uniref:hypothetical protein n=1 Tax=Streptomyces sp. NBC_00059 TaxID=2975635 RepID=UPI002252D67D|nr:hypothetical protein [Streptomyces sp. NBC_00059]MCX5417746.1 hypothetical protein [Streptomyces sp. NBC_00059]